MTSPGRGKPQDTAEGFETASELRRDSGVPQAPVEAMPAPGLPRARPGRALVVGVVVLAGVGVGIYFLATSL
jgi:hypothetical protein